MGLAVAAVVLVAGCLPSGTRGQGSGDRVTAGGPGGQGGAATLQPSPSGPEPSRTIVPPTPTPAPTFFVYTVRTGDSLNSIAHRYGTTARSIAFWNREIHPSLDPLSASYKPNRLDIGWTLLLIPNDVVDEQDLPDPSADADGSADPSGSTEPG